MGGKKGGREGWKNTGLEGTVCRTRGTQAIQEIRDTGKEGCRKERFRIGWAQERKDAGKEGLRRGRMQDRRDAGQVGCRTVRMQDSWDAGQLGCRKGRRDAGKVGVMQQERWE